MIDLILGFLSLVLCALIVVVLFIGVFYGRKDLIEKKAEIERVRQEEITQARIRASRVMAMHKKAGMLENRRIRSSKS